MEVNSSTVEIYILASVKLWSTWAKKVWYSVTSPLTFGLCTLIEQLLCAPHSRTQEGYKEVHSWSSWGDIFNGTLVTSELVRWPHGHCLFFAGPSSVLELQCFTLGLLQPCLRSWSRAIHGLQDARKERPWNKFCSARVRRKESSLPSRDVFHTCSALKIDVYVSNRFPPFFDDNAFGIYQKILAGKIDFPRHLDFSVK